MRQKFKQHFHRRTIIIVSVCVCHELVHWEVYVHCHCRVDWETLNRFWPNKLGVGAGAGVGAVAGVGAGVKIAVGGVVVEANMKCPGGMAIKHATQIKIGNKHKFVARKSSGRPSFVPHEHAPSWDQVLKSKFVVDSIVIKTGKRYQMSITIAVSLQAVNYLYRPVWCVIFSIDSWKEYISLCLTAWYIVLATLKLSLSIDIPTSTMSEHCAVSYTWLPSSQCAFSFTFSRRSRKSGDVCSWSQPSDLFVWYIYSLMCCLCHSSLRRCGNSLLLVDFVKWLLGHFPYGWPHQARWPQS